LKLKVKVERLKFVNKSAHRLTSRYMW